MRETLIAKAALHSNLARKYVVKLEGHTGVIKVFESELYFRGAEFENDQQVTAEYIAMKADERSPQRLNGYSPRDSIANAVRNELTARFDYERVKREQSRHLLLCEHPEFSRARLPGQVKKKERKVNTYLNPQWA